MPILFGILKKKEAQLTISDLKDKDAMNAKVVAGDIIPVFEFHEPEDVTEEPNLYESGSIAAYTNVGSKKLKAKTHLSVCGHEAMTKLKNAGYTEFIEVTKGNEYAVVVVGKVGSTNDVVKGQDISSILVAQRKRALNDAVPVTEVTIAYKDYTEFEQKGYYVEVDYSPFVDLVRVQQIGIKLLSASADEVVVEVDKRCGDIDKDKLKVFVDGSQVSTSGVTETVHELSKTVEFGLDNALAHEQVVVVATETATHQIGVNSDYEYAKTEPSTTA